MQAMDRTGRTFELVHSGSLLLAQVHIALSRAGHANLDVASVLRIIIVVIWSRYPRLLDGL